MTSICEHQRRFKTSSKTQCFYLTIYKRVSSVGIHAMSLLPCLKLHHKEARLQWAKQENAVLG